MASLSIKASSIPDICFDGSKERSTFWLSFIAPLLMLLMLLGALMPSFVPLGYHAPVIAAGLGTLVLFFLIVKFPTSASQRFVTTTLRRPPHFTPTAVGVVLASAVAVVGAAPIDLARTIPLDTQHAGHLSALFVALSIATGGRYALNFVAMTERLIVLLLCWGSSAMVQDNTVLAIGVVGLSLNVLWNIQSRWTPHCPVKLLTPNL